MDSYQTISVIVSLVGLAISFVVGAAIVVQARFAKAIRDFTKEQTQINRVNQWTAVLSAEIAFVVQNNLQVLEGVKLAEHFGEQEVYKELMQIMRVILNSTRNMRERLDEMKKCLPPLEQLYVPPHVKDCTQSDRG